tara:strand:+ start:1340 stop:1630 length:291 start_codon:yes stop_codon:yes gene_type:complete
MKTWYYIKKWFSRKPQEVDTSEVTTKNIRKKHDGVKLTNDQIESIRRLYAVREGYEVETYAEFTIFCNKKLGINKTRSVYHRIINEQGRYASVKKN